jgi:hypothetical protein
MVRYLGLVVVFVALGVSLCAVGDILQLGYPGGIVVGVGLGWGISYMVGKVR